ncbi:ester cyclase [Microbispora bryophytorum]|uniref:Nuclear transport factor 2 family protein n=1 Tax=Microbispora bryophytorum TaxID=1460882 RepID=A0A8H9H569_9ACTN|nr:nuclear transport factor 2 family protein [Microbispora bryophytorum]MBD3140506.1 nuclear transport factor 2 family protein [Microbispora bryophytorum]TQS01779.1 nuclear transport factor 2 family protein [Microbispora bryophytorum]GGO30119.1 hypothetical protein GCM10011574_66180 [Microbispora bryophytorum]
MPSARELKDRLFTAINRHDLYDVLDCYAPDAVYVGPTGVAEGRGQIAWIYEGLCKVFPDICYTAWYKAPCVDPAFTEYAMTGTHMGPLLLPDGRVAAPTGRRITVRGSCACAVEHGKIITDRDYYDQLELYSQLGISLEPPPGS